MRLVLSLYPSCHGTEMLQEEPTMEETAIIEQHDRYVRELSRQKVSTHCGRTLNADEDSFGIVVLRAATRTAAHQLMIDDPAVKMGVLRARLYPYKIVSSA